MSSNVYKNYQVNVGMPFRMRTPPSFKALETEKEIKGDQEPETELLEFKEDPEEIIAKAREEAELLLKEAHMECIRIIEETRERGRQVLQEIEEEVRQEGFGEGLRQAREEFRSTIERAEEIKRKTEEECARLLNSLEEQVVDIVIDAVRKVVATEISANREAILHIAREAIEKCSNRSKLSLRVADEDYDYLVENTEKLLADTEGVGELEILKDVSLKPGSCVVSTPYGSVDARIQTKLDRLEELLKSGLKEEYRGIREEAESQSDTGVGEVDDDSQRFNGIGV